MKFICSRKLTWVICGNRMFTCSYKHIFPAGCYSGALFKGSSGRLWRENPDSYISSAAVADCIFNRRKSIKYYLTHSKTPLTDAQFNWITDGVLLFVMFAEGWVIYDSFV